MKSSQAKVLHKIGSHPLIARALRAAGGLEPENIFVVVGHQAGKVEEAARASLGPADAEKLRFVMQSEQRGTGHAVKCAGDVLKNASGRLVVFYGDTPAVKAETLRKLAAEHERAGNAATLITIRIDPPPAYGRIVRDAGGDFLKIVEERDCSPEERAITELNPGFYCFDIPPLLDALDRLSPHNAQNEYYLTDVPQLMLEAGLRVSTLFHDDARELDGVNTRAELAAMWKRLRRETIDRLMADGVTIIDPDSTYIDDTVEIGDECKVLNSCVVVSSKLTARNTVGPFAHLRLHAELDEDATIGNFVEVKKSRLGRKTKSMHLTYLGDATIGDRVNIGAGTVTCNYDGKQKNPTVIEDDVKIGSDTMLVAPVRVGRGAVTGAGSVVIKDAPPDSLVAGVPAQVKKKLKE